MKVLIPPPLHSYTGGAAQAEIEAESLRELLEKLDRLYPGISFRIVDEQEGIRPHIRFFVNEKMARNLDHALRSQDRIQIVCALSGG